MTKVLITGGSGLVGKRLSAMLAEKDYEVYILSRSRSGVTNGVRYYQWSLADGTIEEGALDVDHIIHLAGAGVAEKRWTKARKKEIRDSRVLSAALIRDHLQAGRHEPKSIVCASAVGFYGDRGEDILDEQSSMGTGFLADTCEEWERASAEIRPSSPTSILRIGIVLSTLGGALPKLSAPVKMGIGAYLGNGSQYYPWIHIDDLCRMMIYAMEQGLDGIYNACAPNPATNKNLVKTMAHVLKRPFIPAPAPAMVLKLTMGEMAEMLLNGQRTSADKIMSSGFEFTFPELEGALRDIFRREC